MYTVNLRTKILDFRGFDSSRILISRGGIPRPIGNSPKYLRSTTLDWRILSLRVDRTAGSHAGFHDLPCGLSRHQDATLFYQLPMYPACKITDQQRPTTTLLRLLVDKQVHTLATLSPTSPYYTLKCLIRRFVAFRGHGSSLPGT